MSERVKDPGVGAFSKEKAKRFINQDGTFNVKHLNKKKTINEAYIYLTSISWPLFLVLLFVGFVALNIIFALGYLLIGVTTIGIQSESVINDFFRAFFFSVQTITSVGYGRFSPEGIAAGLISSFEALVGLVSFAFITGLLYGRFSKPRSNIQFTKSVLLCKHNGGDALMFRLLSRRKSLIVLPKIKASLSLSIADEKGGYKNEFFELKLERDTITYLPTTWTLVHQIDHDSPLIGYSREQIKALQAELLLLFSYHDDSFNQELHTVHSYLFKNIKVGYKFKKAFHFNDEGKLVLNHALIDEIEPES
ncbi:ion channel [Aquimarina agarilytica]|uniref:ion channel n=1 Tax=Aquimarina agarilytica TaxID=1087449 RepID=UPI0002899D0E|nr:ion channel [Aquimarina agarilytica]